MSDLVEMLRNGLSMSMFASRADLHEAELDLRMQAADEIERLRKDAERYRWLRTNERADVRIVGVGRRMGHDLSAAIDAAMQAKEGA